VIVDVRLFVVLALLVVLAVVVAVGQLVVVVLVCVPGLAMLDAVQRPTAMVVGDVVVVMAMGRGRMSVLGLLPFTFGVLPNAFNCQGATLH
jgi:hypothetical protein